MSLIARRVVFLVASALAEQCEPLVQWRQVWRVAVGGTLPSMGQPRKFRQRVCWEEEEGESQGARVQKQRLAWRAVGGGTGKQKRRQAMEAVDSGVSHSVATLDYWRRS